MDVLSFAQLTFAYRRAAPHVFDDFTWLTSSGKTVLLGPNGAGKTTLLAIAADAFRPDRGEVHLGPLRAGVRSDRAAYRTAVGWMPQQIRAVPGFTVREQVAYAGWLKGRTRRDAWSTSRQALERVDLADLEGRLTSRLSGGQLRRVGLAQALVHEARVLLLDEPTAGLDPAQRATFREILQRLPADLQVIVSTHQVDDLSELFDRVAILVEGTVRLESAIDEFYRLAPAGAERPAEAAYQAIVDGRA